MKKLSVYLDATIPNYVFNTHTPEKQKFATLLFEAIKQGKLEAFISKVVIDEIAASPEPKQTKIANILKDVSVLEVTDECNELAEEYIHRRIIPAKNKEDALHIAIASYYGLDAVVSYNFEHIVKLKTKREISGTNLALGYKVVDLVIPEEVLE